MENLPKKRKQNKRKHKSIWKPIQLDIMWSPLELQNKKELYLFSQTDYKWFC